MAGTILDKGNNKYLLRYMHNGKRYNKTVTADSKKKATKLLNEFIYEIEHNTASTNNNMFFNDFVDIWLKDYVEKKLSNRTEQIYKGLLKQHITSYFNGFKLGEIKRIDIIHFLDSINDIYTKASLDKYRKCLNVIFNYAIECELLEYNPCILIKSPKGRDYTKKENVYTLEQVNCLLMALENEDIDKQCIVELGLFCGLRRQEIMALHKEDLDFKNKSININKAMIFDFEQKYKVGNTKTTGSNRTVYIPTGLANKLTQLPSGKLFNFDTAYITKWFNRFITRNKLPYITLHGLRHTYATLLISNNTDYKTVSMALGHSQTSTTMNIYVHKNEDNLKKTVYLFENINK